MKYVMNHADLYMFDDSVLQEFGNNVLKNILQHSQWYQNCKQLFCKALFNLEGKLSVCLKNMI